MNKIMGGITVAGVLLIVFTCGALALGVGIEGARQNAIPEPSWTVGQTAEQPLQASPQAPGPASAIPAGTVRVGPDIQPGLYRSTPSDMCYWARLRGMGGQLVDIIANDTVRTGVQVTVEIKATDVAFSSTEGCIPWARIG